MSGFESAGGDGGYRRLLEHVDHSLIGLGPLDEFGADLRVAMRRLGYRFETARGECAPGQYEITFRYGPALDVADGHVLYETAAKATAAAHGLSATFMAKFDGGRGQQWARALQPALDRRAPGVRRCRCRRPLRHVAADGALRRRTTRLPARSHVGVRPDRQLVRTTWSRLVRPTSIAWGRDNRTCPIRVIGTGSSLRLEHRVPGADANPHLILAAVIAAGLHGIDHELGAAAEGNAFADRCLPSLPDNLHEAFAAWEASEVATAAFGPDVVRHMAGAARAELDAFGGAVTDWERRRRFERN